MKYKDLLKIKKGDILNTSWGYDMTINDYCKVLENTGKTIKCQKIGKKRVEGSGWPTPNDSMQYSVVPNKAKKVCKPFRIRIQKSRPNINDPDGTDGWLIGSYPYTDETDSDCVNKQRGVWYPWEGTPNRENHAD